MNDTTTTATGSGPAGTSDTSKFRFLHTMIRVKDLEKSIDFYARHLGMQVLYRKDYPSGEFTLAFLGYGDDATHTVIELTHNWGQEEPYDLGNGFGQLRYMKSDTPSKRAWMYEHLGAMLGAGIAFHTAFAVFGVTRLFDIELTGWVAIIPWVAPTVIGIPAIAIWTRHYRQKFGELA